VTVDFIPWEWALVAGAVLVGAVLVFALWDGRRKK
jgi:hypothetical protein